MFGYSISRNSVHADIHCDLIDDMAILDVPLEGLHTETDPGVLEAATMHAPIEKAADRGRKRQRRSRARCRSLAWHVGLGEATAKFRAWYIQYLFIHFDVSIPNSFRSRATSSSKNRFSWR